MAIDYIYLFGVVIILIFIIRKILNMLFDIKIKSNFTSLSVVVKEISEEDKIRKIILFKNKIRNFSKYDILSYIVVFVLLSLFFIGLPLILDLFTWYSVFLTISVPLAMLVTDLTDISLDNTHITDEKIKAYKRERVINNILK